MSPRSRAARLHANKYVLATKYTKAEQDASTPEQWEQMCLEERDELIKKALVASSRSAS